MDLIERHAGAAEEVVRHPWEVARARTLLRLLARLGVDHDTTRWLDVGAGDAWFARQLLEVIPATADVVCWDTGYGDAELTPSPENARLTRTAERPVGRFTGLLMLDVIEHVEDDVAFVGDVTSRCMDDDGWLLVTVPAHQWLYSEHDRALKHYRRYSPRRLHTALHDAGLAVEAHGALFHSLVPARGAAVLKERLTERGGPARERQHGVGHWDRGRLVTHLMTSTLEMEGRLSVGLGVRHHWTPPGLSNWAFCRRRPAGG